MQCIEVGEKFQAKKIDQKITVWQENDLKLSF
jgi:hypothetical protein